MRLLVHVDQEEEDANVFLNGVIYTTSVLYHHLPTKNNNTAEKRRIN